MYLKLTFWYTYMYMYTYIVHCMCTCTMHMYNVTYIPVPCEGHWKCLSHSQQCLSGYAEIKYTNVHVRGYTQFRLETHNPPSHMRTGHRMSSVLCRGQTWLFLLWLSAYSSHILNSFSADPKNYKIKVTTHLEQRVWYMYILRTCITCIHVYIVHVHMDIIILTR